jgi:hypothetical protein
MHLLYNILKSLTLLFFGNYRKIRKKIIVIYEVCGNVAVGDI